MSRIEAVVALTVVGIGVDAVDVDRFRGLLGRRPGFAARVFTSSELADVSAFEDPAERLAVRFAAKEATLKALGRGIGACKFSDIEVVRRGGDGSPSAPSLRLEGDAANLASERNVSQWHVSLTHTRLVAVAVVAALAIPTNTTNPTNTLVGG